MGIKENLDRIRGEIPSHVALVAVSKTHPNSKVIEAYEAGQRIFGENKVQELADKAAQLPKDIEWHMIGHLQRNKVKYIAPFVSLIHSVDSLRLLSEINKRARNADRVLDCLLQVHIASEDTKFGFSMSEVIELIEATEFSGLQNIQVVGLMGMATNSNNAELVNKEFRGLKSFFDSIRSTIPARKNWKPEVLSMGMSNDYPLAIECGSNMIRVGSSIFGARNYNH